MSATTQSNGRVRRSLADQIDRLDDVIDALGEGLNEAVMTVVQESVTLAVREAVQAVLSEVLNNPELRARLAPPAPVAQIAPAGSPTHEQPRGQGWWARLGGAIQAGWNWLAGKVARAWDAISGAVGGAAQAATTRVGGVWLRVRLLTGGVRVLLHAARETAWQLRTPLLIASGAGLAVGVGCYLAGPLVASAVSGVAGFVASLVVGLVRGLWCELSGLNGQDA